MMPDLPFNLGFYQDDTTIHGARRALKMEGLSARIWTPLAKKTPP